MLGMVNSNYSGIYGLSINPSGLVSSRLYMDFNAFGAQGFVENNYIYMQRNEFLTLLRDQNAPIYYSNENEIRNYNIYRNSDLKFGYQNVRITGPSGMISLGRHAFGITSAFRNITSFHDIPPEIGTFIYEAIDYEVQHNIEYSHDENIEINSVAWMELGFSYAYNFHRKKWNYWSIGVTLKPLFGLAGMYASIDNLRYEVHKDDSTSIYNADFEYGVAIPLNYNTNQIEDALDVRGKGFSFDLGMTYQRTEKGKSTTYYTRLCEKPFEEYTYRIGVSLLDVGYIRFDNNSEYARYTSTATEWYERDDTLSYNSFNDVLERIAGYLEDEAEIAETGKEFTLYMPPTISVQVDFKLRKGIYLNASAFYGFNFGESFLYRPSLISITPRFESPRLEISIPISLLEFQFSRPRVGFFIRYGNVFFGMDRINTVTGISGFDGIDAYAGIRLNLSKVLNMNFIKGHCGDKNLYNIETFDYRNF